MRAVIRWLRRAWDDVCWLFGILACLVMLVVLLPLMPVLRLYDDVRRRYDDG